ncbi:hypothetical protein BG005_009004 [Podila minutissima]|nr:hypothetical protein BG005_009004 [Podila minutissima]
MNLIASSQDDPRLLFVANQNNVLVYRYSTLMPNQPPKLIKKLIDPRNTQDNTRDTVINAIRVDYLGTEEIVATVNHSGGVCVWFTMGLQKVPFMLSASESAWGLAIHSDQRMIAVSTNAHLVDVFRFGIDTAKLQSSRTLAPDLSADPSTSTLSESHQIFRGHLHNIPCVAFSPCGRFLASTSLDGTCRTWNIASGKETQHASFGDLWGWGVSFVDQDAWTTITRKEYKAIPKSHLRPGQLPGQQVRDSPMATQPFRYREQPPGRLLRIIRSRWFAGPMANTSCDEDSEEDDDEELEGDEDDSSGWEDAEEEDTRGATDSEQSGEASHTQESSSGEVKKAGSSSRRPVVPNSHFPSNLLVCATARNIYLLSRYPYPEGMEKHHDVSGLPVTEPSTSSHRTAHDPDHNVSAGDLQEDLDDEHGDEGQDFDDESPEDEYEDFEDDEEYQIHGEDSYDDEDDDDDDDELMLDLDDGEAMDQESAAYYEGENEIWLFQTEDGDDDEDSDNDDMEDVQDSPEAATLANAGSNFTERNPLSRHKSNKTYRHDPTEMHVLSVARAAVNRADGRGVRQLEHFDRLFYMQVVPELSILVAASQKGCVTIFRLMRVLDDSSTAAAPARGTDQMDDKDSEVPSPVSHTKSSLLCPTPANTLAVQGSKYILFPEMYLPRLEPPFSPLAGISIVPMQRNPLSNRNPVSSSSTPTSSSASFILHMLYLNNVMLSYELCIKNKKNDPVGLNNLFV